MAPPILDQRLQRSLDAVGADRLVYRRVLHDLGGVAERGFEPKQSRSLFVDVCQKHTGSDVTIDEGLVTKGFFQFIQVQQLQGNARLR